MEQLKVSEIFYSLQGEGRRAGEPSIFIRLQGCKAQHACFAAGIRCDTEFESGRVMTLEEIAAWCEAHAPGCRWIVWTGGEPADQLTEEVIRFFGAEGRGYLQAIETSGLHPVPAGLDWITLSPKVAEHVVARNFPDGVTEIKYVRHVGQAIPAPRVKATYQFLSPHSDGAVINLDNLRYCIALCRQHPDWSLSVQQHKLWGVL